MWVNSPQHTAGAIYHVVSELCMRHIHIFCPADIDQWKELSQRIVAHEYNAVTESLQRCVNVDGVRYQTISEHDATETCELIVCADLEVVGHDREK